jgi:hypothetical protein
MKMRINMQAAMVVIGLVCVLMSGCSNESAPAKAPEAPAGFISLRDAGNIPAGTTLYKRDGTVVGTVVAYEAKHKFADGDEGIGIQLQNAKGGALQWTPLDLISTSMFIKK